MPLQNRAPVSAVAILAPSSILIHTGKVLIPASILSIQPFLVHMLTWPLSFNLVSSGPASRPLLLLLRRPGCSSGQRGRSPIGSLMESILERHLIWLA